MQLKLGEKIRELRHRDGRTQEAMSNAIGVSAQAVSRWEANGGYPDMEIIPTIANYFHVTIDELFGYSVEREEKIKKILAKADKMLNAQGDMEPCVSMLREAAEEFPSAANIMLQLGYALNMYGWQKYGARSYTKDGSDYAYADADYNSKNEYWQEAFHIFEKVLEMDINSDDRTVVITLLVKQLANIGEIEKAKLLSQKQDSISICRECLLPKATEGEERDKYQGEAFLILMNELKQIMEDSVLTKLSLATTETGIEKLLSVAHLYEAILDDGRCGAAHSNLSDLYLRCSIFEARRENTDKAMEYFDKAFAHKKSYESILGTGLYQYTAPLVSKVTVTLPSENLTAPFKNSWKGWLHIAPENLQKAIKADKRYAECFKKDLSD